MITYVTGGARSGKSGYAQSSCETHYQDQGLTPLYLATARVFDSEFEDRIQKHKDDRGPEWTTIECPVDLGQAILDHSREDTVLMVDCLTLWLTNIMLEEHDLDQAKSALLDAFKQAKGPIYVISNELGMGIVPENKLSRQFRDEMGRLNQAVASVADVAIFVVSGLPLVIKQNTSK